MATEDERIISGAREMTRDNMFDRARRGASALHNLDVAQDDAVALLMRNDFSFFEVSLALGMLGAYPVPVNWHFKTEEVAYILKDCGARLVVAHADLLAVAQAAAPTGVQTIAAATPPEIATAYRLDPTACAVPAEIDDWDALVAANAPWDGPPAAPRSSMLYTSGTTGRPKGVRRKPFETVAQRHNAKERLRIIFDIAPDREIRTVITGPLYHAAPNTYGLGAVQTGGLVVMMPRFDPEELLALIEQHRITHVHMVPTMFVRLLKLPEETRNRYDLSSLRFVVHAAAPCPPEVKRKMIEWWGPIINEYYGSTESGACVFHTGEEALRKPGTVGRAIYFARLEIHDDHGRTLGPNEVGEIYLGLNDWPDFDYHNQPERREAIGRGALITNGEIGYLDEDGYLFLHDRKTDMVISGGVNIYPAEIEAALLEMPGVQDCAVFGVPNEEFGESLCAHVAPQPDATLTPEGIQDWLRGQLASYKVPRQIVLDRDLPREDSGKIFKRRIRDRYWEGAGRRI